MHVVFYSDNVRLYNGFYAEYTSSDIGFPHISEKEESGTDLYLDYLSYSEYSSPQISEEIEDQFAGKNYNCLCRSEPHK